MIDRILTVARGNYAYASQCDLAAERALRDAAERRTRFIRVVRFAVHLLQIDEDDVRLEGPGLFVFSGFSVVHE